MGSKLCKLHSGSRSGHHHKAGGGQIGYQVVNSLEKGTVAVVLYEGKAGWVSNDGERPVCPECWLLRHITSFNSVQQGHAEVINVVVLFVASYKGMLSDDSVLN